MWSHLIKFFFFNNQFPRSDKIQYLKYDQITSEQLGPEITFIPGRPVLGSSCLWCHTVWCHRGANYWSRDNGRPMRSRCLWSNQASQAVPIPRPSYWEHWSPSLQPSHLFLFCRIWRLFPAEYIFYRYIDNRWVSQQPPEQKCSCSSSRNLKKSPKLLIHCSMEFFYGVPQGLCVLMWYFERNFWTFLAILKWSKMLKFST